MVKACCAASLSFAPSVREKKSSPKFFSGAGMFRFLPILFLFVAQLFAGGLMDVPCMAATESPGLQVGSELDFPPYAFVDDAGRPAGFSVELIKAVAEAMGLTIKISTGPWDEVWKALAARQVDVLPLVAKLPERQLLVDFSLPHTETYDAFFVRKGTPSIQDIESAKGKEIVVMRSDAAHHALLERNFPDPVILVSSIAEGLALISSGKHDAFLCSKLIGTMVIKEHRITGLTAGPLIPDYKRVFSFAVKKGDTELLEKLNQGLLIIKTNGEYNRIYEKWLTADDPWKKWVKYLLPGIVTVTAVVIIGACWLLALQILVKKRTRELAAKNEMLRLAREGLEERVAERTANLATANLALQTEIGERKRAEGTLRKERDFSAGVLDTAGALVVVLDKEGRIMRFNRACEAITGYSAPEVSGRVFWGFLVPPEELEGVLQTWKALKSGNFPNKYENRWVAKDGSVRLIAWSNTAIVNPEGEIDYIIGTGLDITERKQIEEELRLSRDELERRVQERTEELKTSHQRLQQLASQLLQAQERERKRVAIELHDGLLSELAAVKMLFEGKLSLWEQGKLSDLSEFRKISDTLSMVMKETRGIMNNLHPSILDELGLIATIHWMAGEYQKSYPHIKIQKQIEVTEKDMPGSVRVVIYRVLQEALNNFAKHGKGDLVELSLTKSNSTFTFMIRDNGQGFHVETAVKGLGLDSMRERVEIADGKFTLESACGVGTTICASWPLSENP